MTLSEQNDMAGWPPQSTVFPISSIDLTVFPGEHPFHMREQEAARENWAREIAANPSLYDGRMIFQHRLSLTGGAVKGEAYVTPFSTFLLWRKQRQPGAFHLFAFPVIVSSDGAIIAIRMAAHTANPGQVYCASGSMDENDIVDGHADVEGNMRREVLEETGLDLRDATPVSGYHAMHIRRSITLLRVFRFPWTAEEMLRRIEAHMLVSEEDEVDGVVAIRSADPTAHPYNIAMLPILAWFFDSDK
ncbi:MULTISPECIES: DNA mismatch repair protein MutT [unclassified Rhizobium]|jgi:8-oxo-dGTP pyrophosphatase MutT (NUDIX family)|uniref:DNA mismatch repair protein MutT n=1 Tax=unclassified Rhizobium TaxID=2613769 RepID=UPI000BA84C24|nr:MULTISPECIES: DNA mismatch repair protein MutT [unclassified Rhizobium]ASW06944.1 DNA mismatch repair protein MutT [Rhizobium sp. 11515TR]MDK4711991.1 NUDIX hydrolase [Rhizobium sp. CNPSo 4039]